MKKETIEKFSLEYFKENYNYKLTLNDIFKIGDDICEYTKNKNNEEIKEILNNFINFKVYLIKEKGELFLTTHSGIERLYKKVYGKSIIDTL